MSCWTLLLTSKGAMDEDGADAELYARFDLDFQTLFNGIGFPLNDDFVAAASSSRSPLELPVYTKYLLIASYLASYNPAKSDKKFFMKVTHWFINILVYWVFDRLIFWGWLKFWVDYFLYVCVCDENCY